MLFLHIAAGVYLGGLALVGTFVVVSTIDLKLQEWTGRNSWWRVWA